MATISEAFAIAVKNHQNGRFQAAEQIYRQILAANPNHANALHLLGVLAHQAGKHDLAVETIERAIRLQGNSAPYYNNLGEADRRPAQDFRSGCRLPRAGVKPQLRRRSWKSRQRFEGTGEPGRCHNVLPPRLDWILRTPLSTRTWAWRCGTRASWMRRSPATAGPWQSSRTMPGRTITSAMR